MWMMHFGSDLGTLWCKWETFGSHSDVHCILTFLVPMWEHVGCHLGRFRTLGITFGTLRNFIDFGSDLVAPVVRWMCLPYIAGRLEWDFASYGHEGFGITFGMLWDHFRDASKFHRFWKRFGFQNYRSNGVCWQCRQRAGGRGRGHEADFKNSRIQLRSFWRYPHTAARRGGPQYLAAPVPPTAIATLLEGQIVNWRRRLQLETRLQPWGSDCSLEDQIAATRRRLWPGGADCRHKAQIAAWRVQIADCKLRL